MLRRRQKCDLGLLLGETAYYITGDGAMTSTAVKAENAVGEATSFFCEQWAKREGTGVSLRFAVETPSLLVEKRSVAMMRRRLGQRQRMRAMQNIAVNACFAWTVPRATREGVFAYLAIEEHGLLRQLRERPSDDGAIVAGGWPWLAVCARLADRVNSGKPSIVVTLGQTFSSVATINGSEITEYFPHHHEQPHERTLAWSTIREEVQQRKDHQLLLVTPDEAWAGREVEMWPELTGMAGATVCPLALVLEVVNTFSAQGHENLLYTANDNISRLALEAVRVMATGTVLLGAWWFWAGHTVAEQSDRTVLAFKTQQAAEEKTIADGTAIKAAIDKLRAGILTPIVSDATGSSWLIDSVSKAVPNNMLVLGLRVEKHEWTLETVWFPPRNTQGADAERARVYEEFLAKLKEASFPAEKTDTKEARSKIPGAQVIVGHMP
jgi:hypothetical protein